MPHTKQNIRFLKNITSVKKSIYLNLKLIKTKDIIIRKIKEGV